MWKHFEGYREQLFDCCVRSYTKDFFGSNLGPYAFTSLSNLVGTRGITVFCNNGFTLKYGPLTRTIHKRRKTKDARV